MSFRIVLYLIGALLGFASRRSSRVRAQLSRDMTMEISSMDGTARSYVVRKRLITAHSGRSSAPTCRLIFASAGLGTRTLLAHDTVARLVDGFGRKDIECHGEAAIVLWFYELFVGLLPWHRKPRDSWPQSYTAPDPRLKASARIIREPAVDGLEPQWTAAHAQREKTILWRVGRGATPEGKVKHHKIVVDMSSLNGGHQP